MTVEWRRGFASREKIGGGSMLSRTIGLFLVVILDFTTIHFAFAQETAGMLLGKLAKLSPEARQKALVDGARAEKEVTFLHFAAAAAGRAFCPGVSEALPVYQSERRASLGQ